MSSIGNQGQLKREIGLIGFVRTLLVQAAVLLALAGAVVWYLDWSSDAAWSEFISAGKSPVSSSNHRRQSQASVLAVKAEAVCARGA